MLDQITPVVLTRDEEANIVRTLSQLTWAREVIVVDSYSTDRTVARASDFPNVRVVQRAFDEHARQWMFGLEQIATPWVMALDADYFVPSELRDEISALQPDRYAGYRARFRYAVEGRLLRATLYPPRVVLSSAAHTTFWQDGHTQRILVTGPVGELQVPIIHDDRKTFRSFVERQRRYAVEEAHKLRSTRFRDLPTSGRARKAVLIAPPAVLLYTLFGKGLFLDGASGVRYAIERFVAEALISRELLRGDRHH